jgi:hypothetical protein
MRDNYVEDDLKLDEGIGACGKDGQSVPVGVGMPTVKLDRIPLGKRGDNRAEETRIHHLRLETRGLGKREK